ncbi:MAG: Gfo/Idh/MocA family oxidoreductase [Sphaerochaeta sp.]
MKIILIGYGWRSLFYYRIIKALPQQFTLVNWVLRSEERASEVRNHYHVETTCDVRVALAVPHDLVVLCLPSGSLETLLVFLIEQQETILCETGFTALHLETLTSIYAKYRESQSKVLVAEQYYRYPYFHTCHALLPLLGPLAEVRVACLHDHHGTSIIRHFLGEKGNDCSISASNRTNWIVRTGKRDTIDTDGIRIQTKRTTATLEFKDGKTGYFDFDDVQYHSCIRSSHFSLFGERGEVFDENVRYLNAENDGIFQTIQRIEDGGVNNNPLSLRAMAFKDEYQFRNPYWPLSFNDDEIALALCLEDACHGKGYSLAEALQDSYLAQCMQRSCTEKKTIETESQIWTEAFSSESE